MRLVLNDMLDAKGTSVPLREVVVALMAKLEAAEKERDALRAELAQLHKEADKFGDGIDWIQRALQAEAQIEQMERQEPVARLLTWVGKDPYNKNRVIARTYDELHKNAYPEWEEGSPLYLPHGAQNVPSVPEGWKLVPDKHPTFDPVDLQLADGSVLCGCVPQSDGDYWWEGPSGEVFIDPRYAPVTHWRLAAAPEAKP